MELYLPRRPWECERGPDFWSLWGWRRGWAVLFRRPPQTRCARSPPPPLPPPPPLLSPSARPRSDSVCAPRSAETEAKHTETVALGGCLMGHAYRKYFHCQSKSFVWNSVCAPVCWTILSVSFTWERAQAVVYPVFEMVYKKRYISIF